MNFDEICKWLVKDGFRRVSLSGHNKQTYISDDYTVTIIIEEHKDELTEKDVKRIKKRLKDLGYL